MADNSIFNRIGMPHSASSLGRVMEKEKQRLRHEEKLEERELHRDKTTEKYNQKSLEIAEQAKLLSEKSIAFTKCSLWIGSITLLVTTIGAIFTILSYIDKD